MNVILPIIYLNSKEDALGHMPQDAIQGPERPPTLFRTHSCARLFLTVRRRNSLVRVQPLFLTAYLRVSSQMLLHPKLSAR